MPCIEAMDKNVLAFKGILLRWHTHTHTYICIYAYAIFVHLQNRMYMYEEKYVIQLLSLSTVMQELLVYLS